MKKIIALALALAMLLTVSVGEDAAPSDTLATDYAPSDVIPSDSVPTDVIPSDNVPTDVVPSDSVPTDVIPSDSVPTDVIPSDSVPTDVIPSDGVPTDVIPSDVPAADSSPDVPGAGSDEQPVEPAPADEPKQEKYVPQKTAAPAKKQEEPVVTAEQAMTEELLESLLTALLDPDVTPDVKVTAEAGPADEAAVTRYRENPTEAIPSQIVPLLEIGMGVDAETAKLVGAAELNVEIPIGEIEAAVRKDVEENGAEPAPDLTDSPAGEMPVITVQINVPCSSETLAEVQKATAPVVGIMYDKYGNWIIAGAHAQQDVSMLAQNIAFQLPSDLNIPWSISDDGRMTEHRWIDNNGMYYAQIHDGMYHINGTVFYLSFAEAHYGSFGAITNRDGLEKLKQIYGHDRFAPESGKWF